MMNYFTQEEQQELIRQAEQEMDELMRDDEFIAYLESMEEERPMSYDKAISAGYFERY